MVVDFNYFLNRKYAQLQQQADATTANARAATQNAETNALTGAAAARLDTTRAKLLPAESRATVAKIGAETNLIGEQAKIVAPESLARIGQIRAETALTGTQNEVARRQGLTSIGELLGDRQQSGLINLLYGSQANAGGAFRTSDIVPGRDPRRVQRGLSRNPSAADLDYANGL